MKKLAQLVIVLLIGCTQSNAQIVISRSDFGSIGDTVLYANDTTLSGLSIGAAGANVAWDFSTTASANYYDSAVFADPLTIPGSPIEANLAISEASTDQYFYIDNSQVRLIIPLDQFGLDNQLIRITAFPATYGDILHDSAHTQAQGTPEDFGYSGLPFDSVRATVDVHTTSAVDGWGTLKTLNETYDALRVRNITNVTVKLEGKAPIFGWTVIPSNLNRSQELYEWYGKNKKFSLAEALMDTSGNVVSFKYQVNNVPVPTGLKDLTRNSINSLYPNPANSHLSIELKGDYYETVVMEITDINGKVISSETIHTNGSVTHAAVNTTDFPDGIYLAHFTSAHTSNISKFIVKH